MCQSSTPEEKKETICEFLKYIWHCVRLVYIHYLINKLIELPIIYCSQTRLVDRNIVGFFFFRSFFSPFLLVTLLLKVESYISLKLFMCELEWLPMSQGNPLSPMLLYHIHYYLKWELLKIAMYRLCSILENKMSVWHLAENKYVVFIF